MLMTFLKLHIENVKILNGLTTDLRADLNTKEKFLRGPMTYISYSVRIII